MLPAIKKALEDADELILQAPPGAGKTTAVPLALLDCSWLNGKILMLEPRRMAARAAAQRMAEILRQSPGETVGYRVRGETRVGPNTRVEVVTGGVLTRLLLADPSLADYSLIIFDEFHERGLDSDAGLALALQGRNLFRDDCPLKLLVMSATLDEQPLSDLLPNCEVIVSEGRQFPVAVYHGQAHPLSDLVPQVCRQVQAAAQNHQGDLLVFLPGQKEILSAQKTLASQLPSSIRLAPLYGSLNLNQQQHAIAPCNQRRIVLATDIAETSLTIPGVEVVIDSGYRRAPVFDPRTGLTRLSTIRISQASARQRAGRAGRLGPGHCYRLWPAEQPLAAHDAPEISQADLSSLALQLLAWGVSDPEELRWVSPPPASAWQQGLDLLHRLGGIHYQNAKPRLTAHGETLANFPAHPRLAHMMLKGAQHGWSTEAATLAAVLSEPGRPADTGVDLEILIEQLLLASKDRRPWVQRVLQQTKQFQRDLPQGASLPNKSRTPVGCLIAWAYPDRIAKQRIDGHQSYQLSSGRAARLPEHSSLTRAHWLAVAETGGSQGQQEDRIYLAAPLDPETFNNVLEELTRTESTAYWDERQQRFVAEQRTCIGALIWRQRTETNLPSEQKTAALINYLLQKGWQQLPWDAHTEQWLARVQLLKSVPECQSRDLPPWPDVSTEGLQTTMEVWLGPHLNGVTTLAGLKKLNLAEILAALLPWPLPQKLEEWAPTHFTVPSGSRIAVDYCQERPVLAVKLQEMFGCQNTPTVARGKVSLVIHLLSPARRPLQITQDLAGFWRTTYADVKKEMQGRYPKHPWPEDPLNATATRHTKNRMGS